MEGYLVKIHTCYRLFSFHSIFGALTLMKLSWSQSAFLLPSRRVQLAIPTATHKAWNGQNPIPGPLNIEERLNVYTQCLAPNLTPYT